MNVFKTSVFVFALLFVRQSTLAADADKNDIKDAWASYVENIRGIEAQKHNSLAATGYKRHSRAS